ncbi:histone-fold-containing protein [Fistulina hepatica ATCC 64428]|uniref:DNA polymerase epsilon subunit D n=1 Tax=Fistulina hepatica ATCC 64428 TaxID=1128425 RepID=A0A0D7A814_9AGAR|nr:histone-fold-containing protein [Fistulina hepatica ATCC 64428]
MPRKDMSGGLSAQTQQEIVSEGIENYELPKSVVTKIAKSALPDNSRLQKETVLSLVKGSTVFVNYLAATAHDIAVSKQHKSISASDVLRALEQLEFGDLVDQLQEELTAFRENAKKGERKASSGKGTRILLPGSKGKAPALSPYTTAPLESESISGTGHLPTESGAQDEDEVMEDGDVDNDDADADQTEDEPVPISEIGDDANSDRMSVDETRPPLSQENGQ